MCTAGSSLYGQGGDQINTPRHSDASDTTTICGPHFMLPLDIDFMNAFAPGNGDKPKHAHSMPAAIGQVGPSPLAVQALLSAWCVPRSGAVVHRQHRDVLAWSLPSSQLSRTAQLTQLMLSAHVSTQEGRYVSCMLCATQAHRSSAEAKARVQDCDLDGLDGLLPLLDDADLQLPDAAPNSGRTLL